MSFLLILTDNFFRFLQDQNTLQFRSDKSYDLHNLYNIAVDACKSKYLAFIDSDAYPGTNWIESTFKFIKRKNVGIIAGPHVDPPN